MSFCKFLRVSIGILFCIFAPLGVEAAILYLEPVSGEYHQGDTFIINIRIDPEEDCVNTIQADLEFSRDYLEVKDISKGNSIISFWVKEPEFSNEAGFISFAGGIPGGFCGILPGDPGESDFLGKIIFSVKLSLTETQSAEVRFLDSSQVLLNDGLGTPAKLATKGATIKITEVSPMDILKNEWQKELEKDKIPPEPFEIEIHQELSIFEGEYFVTFQTQDKQTGIDHYEVKEGGRDWRIAISPYLLEDQSLKSIIKVKAVDKAGNERVAEYAPLKAFLGWIIIVILAAGGAIWWLVRKLKIKNEKS